MEGTAHTDVLVVGAGPVGLLLAGELSVGGVRTVVLERLAEPTAESRASILHTRTMEIFAERGILERLGAVPDGGHGHFGGIPLHLSEADPGHPYGGQWECLQSRLEPVLAEWAADQGAEVRRNQVLTGVSQAADRVEAEVAGPDGTSRHLTARYLVGCDGQHSAVRWLARFEVTGQEATREMLRADVRGIDIPDRRLRRYPGGTATAYRRADGLTRLMVHDATRTPGPHSGEPDFTEVAAAWTRVTGEDVTGGTAVWLNRFDNTSRQARGYRKGRVFLAGDAAHVQMPIGGQALNLGLHDAASLGPKLAAHVTGRAADHRLDDYETERHPVGARTLANIRTQALLLFGSPEVDGMREVLGELLEMQPVRRHLARMISGLAGTPAPTTERGHTARPSTHPSVTHRSPSMDRLAGKTALVTGSSRGIGRATAIRLAREGALVTVHYASNDEAAQDTVGQIEKEGGRAFPLRAELGVPGDVHELFVGLEQGLKERTGETRLDILVNNAAVTASEGTPPEDVTADQLQRYFAVNAIAPFLIVQRAAQNMPDGGRIINISSGLTRFAVPEQAAYSMTKGAIEQISLHMAKHLASRGITVNSVAPGITDNGGPVFDIPEAVEQMAQVSAFKRVGKAEDVADVVTFLATDEARWITGSFVDASGGTLLG
jgi:bifunctional oxygenase/reductase